MNCMVRIVKKPDERRADIIKAARILFLTKEYERTTMQDVMNALDIAKGTIYHYFKSKEELLEAVVKDIVNKNFEKIGLHLSKMRGNAIEKIQKITEMSNMAVENAPVLEQLHKSGNEALHLRLLVATLSKLAPFYAMLIEKGCKEGLFKVKEPLECAEFILSGVQFLTDTGIYPWTQEDLARRVKAFPQLIEQMLQAPAGSFQFLVK
jgi:AcrR family transcriptional regulator